MDDRQPEWKASDGYTIDTENGRAVKHAGTACTLYFYEAQAGESLSLLNQDYEYAVATYAPRVNEKYLYTYDYEPEENWTAYRGDFDGKFSTQAYVFSQTVYFRVIIRRRTKQRETENGFPPLSELLLRHRGADADGWPKRADSAVCRKEIKRTAETARACADAPKSLTFFLLTDTHYTVGGTWQDTVRNLHEVQKELNKDGADRTKQTGQNRQDIRQDILQGIIHLGDATDGMVPAEITRSYVSAMNRDLQELGVPMYYALGNHDYNYFRGNPERFSEQELRELYLQGREKTYYDADFPEQGLKMIFLESFDPTRQVRYGFSDEELDWLEGLLAGLLREKEQKRHVLICSHVPPTARLHYWSNEIEGSRRLLKLLKKYQACSHGGLLGFICGHNHADQVDVQEGFPIISIGCAKCEYFTDKKPMGAVPYERALHTVSQDLWDVMTVSAERETIDFIRFGAGEDRHIDSRAVYQAQNTEDDRNGGRFMKKVITYGTFDLFHEGHYNLLKRAKELGDYLIVGVTTEHFDEQRGKINIVDCLLERIENVRKTGFADEIIIEDHEGQKIEDIQKYDVDIFTVGSDWLGSFDYLNSYCQVVYLERTPDISSTMLRKNKFPIVRLGVVGTGRIAPRFIAEARYVSGLNIRSVYNPHQENAEAFAGKYALEAYSDSYEDFLDAVDAVYVATPHETHYDYAKRALQQGKHVLCEKPLVFTKEQAAELFALAKEKGLVLMEGIKTAYCPGFAQLMNVAKSGKIGEIRDVEACFSRLTAPHLREMADTQYGGAFLEFGSYTVLPILKLLGLQYDKVEINSILAENGVDLYTKIQFLYPHGMAMSKTGIGVKSEGQLLISGTKGYILAESPWWLTKRFQVRYEDPGKVETYTPNFVGDGLRYEIGDFIARIHGRDGHTFKLTEEETIAMADVVERFMEKRRQSRQEAALQNRNSGVKIWAHRGCSHRYPENTMQAFAAACQLEGLAGIELDVQLTKDGRLAVFHDETVDRLLAATGNIRDFTWAELQELRFKDCQENVEVRVPALEQVLQLVKPYAQQRGVMLNIELKNGVVPYEGMEEKLLAMVKEYGMQESVIYSSFNPQSVYKLKTLDAALQTGILQSDIQKCIELMPVCHADALHPKVDSVTAAADIPEGVRVRAWNSSEPFYKQDRYGTTYQLCKLKEKGITDLITNVPEEYLTGENFR